jgi:hypothetical protein
LRNLLLRLFMSAIPLPVALVFFGLVFLVSFNICFAENIYFETKLPWYYNWSAVGFGNNSITRIRESAIQYTPAVDQTICNIKVGLYKTGDPLDPITMTVKEGTNYPTTGVTIATKTVSAADVPGPFLIPNETTYTSFNFSPCLIFKANTSYFLIFSRPDPTDLNKYVLQASNNIYYSQTKIWSYTPVNYYWNEVVNYEPALRLEGESLKEPIIIVPGILGSELYNGDDLIWPDLLQMAMDPGDEFLRENLMLDSDGKSIKDIEIGDIVKKIAYPPVGIDIFDSLINKLISSDYTLNKDLFLLPYDWRLDLKTNKELLNQKVQEAKSISGHQKVNIVAHSMGGLLTKEYLSQYGKNDIDNLIFIGTPHLGAPKAGKVLLEGDRFGIPWLSEDIMQQISINSPSSYELLPIQKYFDQFTGYFKKSTDNLPLDYQSTKDFLATEGLSPSIFNIADNYYQKNLQDFDFSGINTYNITGCKTNTQSGYILSPTNEISTVKYSSGDGTVPMISADYINIPDSNKFYFKSGNHVALPSTKDIREVITEILSSQPITQSEYIRNDSSFCNFEGKELLWRSPVEIHIYDSHGNHTGPTENNTIEYGIKDIGYDIIGHEKFVFLPTDNGETYSVVAKGLEQGTFDLLVSNNDNGTTTETKVFNDVEITPASIVNLDISNQSMDDKILFDKNGTGETVTILADATLGINESDDLIPPESKSQITGTTGNNGWLKSDATITFIATDDLSGILKTLYSIDNGLTFSEYSSPITITKEGISTLKFYSIDKAGNDEKIKTIEIKIDKIAPEYLAYFDTTKKDYTFLAKDNLDLSPTSSCTTSKCTTIDIAGNSTQIEFQKIKILSIYTLNLKTLKYNDALSDIKDNVMIVNFLDNKTGIQIFDQTYLTKGWEINRLSYNKSKNQTTIVTLAKGTEIKKESVTGLKFLQLNTSRGIIKVNIK